MHKKNLKKSFVTAIFKKKMSTWVLGVDLIHRLLRKRLFVRKQ